MKYGILSRFYLLLKIYSIIETKRSRIRSTIHFLIVIKIFFCKIPFNKIYYLQGVKLFITEISPEVQQHGEKKHEQRKFNLAFYKVGYNNV